MLPVLFVVIRVLCIGGGVLFFSDQANRQTGRQTDEETNRQAYKQADEWKSRLGVLQREKVCRFGVRTSRPTRIFPSFAANE